MDAETSHEAGDRKIILSGIQPSGKLHIGNLVGALRNWAALQDEYECYFFIADMHSITVRLVPAELRKSTLDIVATLLAVGINPEISTLFVQSHIPEHAQLAWVLNCFTSMGECSRMTQFKDKSAQNAENINVGLFAYPALQAADILIYQADLVPVGEDQKQHLELTRDLAQRFNHYYSDTFKVPEPYIPPYGAKIMSLQEPTKKMSKSDENAKSTLYLTDSDEEIRNKIKRSVTDSGSDVVFTAEKPGISNLITLYHVATGKAIKEIEKEFEGKGYGEFKPAVGEALVRYLHPLRECYFQIRRDEDKLKEILTQGADRARRAAIKTLRKVYKKVGFLQI